MISLMPPAGEITGCTPVGSVGVLQPVDHLLAHEIVVAAVFELQADEAERVDVFERMNFRPGVLATARSRSGS